MNGSNKLIPIVKKVADGKITHIAFFNFENRNMYTCPVTQPPQSNMPNLSPDDLKSLPVWGARDGRIVLIAKDGDSYIIFCNGNLSNVSLEEVVKLTRKGFTPVNFTVVHAPDKRVYLRLRKGVLYKYATLQGDQAWLVHINATRDMEDCSSLLFFHSLNNAKQCYNKHIQEAKQIAKDAGWEEETVGMSYMVWEDGAYCENHIEVSLQPIEYEDAKPGRK